MTNVLPLMISNHVAGKVKWANNVLTAMAVVVAIIHVMMLILMILKGFN